MNKEQQKYLQRQDAISDIEKISVNEKIPETLRRETQNRSELNNITFLL